MIFLIENKLKRNESIEEMKKKLIDSIIADSMASFYIHVCEKFSWLIDEDSLKTMKVCINVSNCESVNIYTNIYIYLHAYKC
jgi:hypothetical protein